MPTRHLGLGKTPIGRWLRPLRDPSSMWRLEPGVGWVIAILFTVFAVARLVPAAGKFIYGHLALWPKAALLKLELWQLFTALFVHVQLSQVVFDAIFLYLMGSFLERTLGRARFFRFFLLTGVAGYAVAALVTVLLKHDRMLMGIEPSLFALMLSSGLLFGRQQIQLFGAMAVRADVVSWFFAGFWLLRYLLEFDLPMLGVCLGAGGAAWLLLRRKAGPGGGGGPGGGLPNMRNLIIKRRPRGRFEVLEGGKRPEKKWLN